MMKGVVLAGGTGSRLFPLTKVTNKHLLPIGTKPMIYYPIAKLVEAGIHEILIVTGREHMGDVVNLLGSGKDFACSFTYKVQDEAGGIAQALLLAEHFAGGEPVTVILGDNIFEDSIKPMVDEFMSAGAKGASVLLKKVHDPSRYGVATVKGDRISHIVEKPEIPPTDLAVTGIYIFDSSVFDFIKTLEPSARGELEITDVNNHFVKRGDLRFAMMKGWWTDAGTFESWFHANQLALGKLEG